MKLKLLAALFAASLIPALTHAQKQNFPAGDSSGSASLFSNSIILSTNCGSAANCYQIFADTKYISDATFTNGANTVSCPNNDCNFVAATDNGKVCWGTNATTDVSTVTSVVALPEGTLTVTGAQTATCSGGNASNSGAAGANFFVWGHLDTPANGAGGTDQIAAASLAAANACQPLLLPTGVLQIEQVNNLGNNGPTNGFCNQNSAVNTRKGFSIVGQGPTATVFLITPNTVGTNCTGPNGTGVGCWLSNNNMVAKNFEMTCLGNSAMGATFNGKSLTYMSGVPINGGSNFAIEDVILLGCGAQTAGLKGLNIGNGVSGAISGGLITDSIVEAWGNTMVVNDPGTATEMTQVVNDQFTGCGNSGCLLSKNGLWSSSHTFYGWGTSTTANMVVCDGSTTECDFLGDYFPYQTGTGVAELTGTNGSLIRVIGGIINNPTASGFGISMGTNATVHAQNATIKSATTQNAVNVCSTCSFYEDGPNVYSGLTVNGKYYGTYTLASSVTNPSVASRNTTLGSTTLIPVGVVPTSNLNIQLYAYDSAAGTGCSSNTTVLWTITYTDPTGTSQTQTATETIVNNGGATGGDKLVATFPISLNAGGTVTYQTTYTIGTCTTGPSYAAQFKVN